MGNQIICVVQVPLMYVTFITCYYLCSQVLKGFYNLTDRYANKVRYKFKMQLKNNQHKRKMQII